MDFSLLAAIDAENRGLFQSLIGEFPKKAIREFFGQYREWILPIRDRTQD
ncbi:MAG TPA: hypothetical protein VG271_12845 [Beijerinckiaceae bacterium]|nr:hypothetical protein [Beijerinckiaceae bacterium]